MNVKQGKSDQQVLDFCREQNIPFNDVDKLLYKMQKSKDWFAIYKVIFDQLTNNQKPFMAANSMLTEIPPIKLPDGKVHIGWPSRLETPAEMLSTFRTQMENQIKNSVMSPPQLNGKSMLNQKLKF